jgi:hypothetical protein
MPQRPAWHRGMSPQELQQREEQAFEQWMDRIYGAHEPQVQWPRRCTLGEHPSLTCDVRSTTLLPSKQTCLTLHTYECRNI